MTAHQAIWPAPAAYHGTARNVLAHFEIGKTRAQSLDGLCELLQQFMQIPYENLSKIIKFNQHHVDVESLRMPDEVWEDFRRHKLGGTCFSLSFLLLSVLDYLQYSAYPVMGRMRGGDNLHCALVLLHRGTPYLIDPGYVLDRVMAIQESDSVSYRAAHAGVCISPAEESLRYDVVTFTREKRTWRYSFRNLPVDLPEFFAHWLASFHARGMNGLCLTRHHRDTLYYIHNHYMRETNLDGKRNHNLKRRRAEVVHEIFGIPQQIVNDAQLALDINLKRKYGDNTDDDSSS